MYPEPGKKKSYVPHVFEKKLDPMDPKQSTIKKTKNKQLTVSGIKGGRTANEEVGFPSQGKNIVIVKGCGELVEKYSEGEAECQNHLIYRLGI